MATINDFGIPGVGPGYLHPKAKNRWRITFANMGGGADSQPLSMQAINVTRPSVTHDEIQLDRYTTRAFIAGKYTWDPLSITIQDDVSSSASKVIREQLQRQQWIIGAEGPWLAAAAEGSLYKFVTYLDMLDGGEQVIEKWTVEGCFLQQVNWGDLDYSTGDPVEISLTVRFDHARNTLSGYAGPGVALGGAGKVTE